jgi:undecaprenyl-diphosphatase
MEAFNQSLFLLLNAPQHPPAMLLAIARILADDLIWLAPLALLAGWLRGDDANRKRMLEAALAACLGLLLNQAIGLVWQHPRPFMIGLGRTLVSHAADSSFPSDHLTLMWTVSFSLALHRASRPAGAALALLGLPLAWARIYLGVHFPFDMAGALVVAGISAWLCGSARGCCIEPVFGVANLIYRRLFAFPIQKGWLR